MIQEEKDWFRLKRYPHIGLPLQLSDRGWVENYVSNPKKVESHSFFPFIHRKISVRKFRRDKNKNSETPKLRVATYKVREVYYANHLDSNIYSYYSSLLKDLYEVKLKESGADNCVTAYRRIKLYENETSRNKCNVDFANDIFEYIKSNNKRNLVSITFDITSFFDNLNHDKLKKAWCDVLNETKLPESHYAVFRNLTKFSYLELEDIFEEFKNDIIIKKDDITKRIKVDRLALLKNKDAIAFCETKDFDLRIRKKKLIKKNKHSDKQGTALRNKGIPQGSPISSTLANIYLLQFDKIINEEISKIGGIYRRYSDDMVVIADEEFKDKIIEIFNLNISALDLEIQPSKTQIFYFKEFGGKFTCREYNTTTGLLTSNSKFEYLGFTFDGETIYLKSSGISKFYRKMKRSINRGGFYAKYGKNEVGKLFKNRLYKRFSIRGAKRRTIYKKEPNASMKWIKTNKYEWGNFLSYTELANRVFKKSNMKCKIKSQTRNHWAILHKLMKVKQDSIDELYSKKNHPEENNI